MRRRHDSGFECILLWLERYNEAAWVGFSEQNEDGATIAAEVEQLGPRLEAPSADDLGGEPRWVWVPGYFARILLIQHIYFICLMQSNDLEIDTCHFVVR